MKTLLSLAAMALLAACAAQPQGPAQAAADGKQPMQAGESSLVAAPSTGSRIPNKGQSQIVKQIGSQTYKNDDASNLRSIGNDVGARSN